MLALDDERWKELKDAYGSAGEIPALLLQLESLPSARADEEPWESLWSALAHQGDVYSASFAAVPHVVQALSQDPLLAGSTYFHFPAWVEICRIKTQVEIPPDLQESYFEALARLPSLVAAASAKKWEPDFLACSLSAIAAAKGQVAVAEAVLELTPEVAEEFMEWFFSR
jgi:hypothetical protein